MGKTDEVVAKLAAVMEELSKISNEIHLVAIEYTESRKPHHVNHEWMRGYDSASIAQPVSNARQLLAELHLKLTAHR